MSHTLFLSPGRQQELNQQLLEQEPTALAIRQALSDTHLYEVKSDHLLNDLCLAWLDSDRQRAEEAGEALLKRLQNPTSDLGKGAHGLRWALCLDYGSELWSDELRKQFVQSTADLAVSITKITPGNPHIVTNNWYMITHGACLMACMAAHGREGTNGVIDLSDLENWALGRFRAFMGHFGNEGLYHEGSGYIAYTLSILMPTLVALKNRRGLDLLDEFPNLRNSTRSMLMGTAYLPEKPDGTPAYHAMLDWNDTGRQAAGLNPTVPGITLSRPGDQPALKTFFDRTVGVKGGNRWQCIYSGLPLALALYPFDLPVENPDTALPHSLLDTRQGLAFWRDHWGDGTESIFGWYARSTHASPGHAHDDAGSIRLMSNGASWICGGGQARTKSQWQSVITHAEAEDRPERKPYAYPFTTHTGPTSGYAGIEMRKVLEAYSERYLSWRTDLGFPICLAVLDLVDEHKSPARPFDWNLSFPKELKAVLDEDGKGFKLTDSLAGTLHGRFLLDSPDELELTAMPPSKRTYSSGRKEEYPGDGIISAHFTNRSELRILVAMVVCPNGQPAPELAWSGNDIRLSSASTWDQPFKGAILESVDLKTHRPNLQLYPSGVDPDES